MATALGSNLTTYDARGNAVRIAETSALFVLVSVIATIGVVAYMLFLLDPSHRGDLLPYGMVIVAESILVFQALLSMWTILASGYEPRNFEYHDAKRVLLPHQADGDDTMHIAGTPQLIDVFITVYGEDLATVRRTIAAAVAMRGAHRTWVLDDGRSDDVKDVAEQLGAWYVRRLSSNGAKAGNINHALSIAKGDLFAIFDADFVPDPDFLVETVPFFAMDNVAFVQTPQAYGNLQTIIARGAAYMQTVFYRFVQRGRNRFNAAFCVGTNVIYRRSAIDEIGGIHVDSKSEDVWTALTLHERGWRSIYISDVLAWFVVGSFRWETLTLATASFPIYSKALWNVITGKDVGWHVTGAGSARSPFNFVVPQVLFFVFLTLTSVVGVARDVQNGQPTLATAWNVTNTLILALFIAAAAREAWGPSAASVPAAAPEAAPVLRTIIARPPVRAASPAELTPEGGTA
ncbi:MAG: cellulose synthase catalytic subunit [Microbacterium hominis]|jgi:glycosyltransferase involved in cell wall biosynthesis|uniref:glycosyltransferase family 2 protein n=2 Tax=Microbacterium TaxID=33882 RepID=UPI00248DDEE8|nr:cellulose synthase catalytic subunit [Microbacterium aurum]MBZ6373171.1 cellulose synthase catalytic subunit [Microbacterium hominis]